MRPEHDTADVVISEFGVFALSGTEEGKKKTPTDDTKKKKKSPHVQSQKL